MFDSIIFFGLRTGKSSGKRGKGLFQKVETSEEDDSVKKNVKPLEALASDCEGKCGSKCRQTISL